jgi:hypothetical protein
MAANRHEPVLIFNRDQIAAMHTAFERVCTRMRLRGTKAAPVIELVAIKIVELARAGEFDPEKLTRAALADFSETATSGGSRRALN